MLRYQSRKYKFYSLWFEPTRHSSGAGTAYPSGAPEFTPGCQWGACFFWPLCCLFFFDIRILITPLVSSNSSNGTTYPVKTSCYQASTFCTYSWETDLLSYTQIVLYLVMYIVFILNLTSGIKLNKGPCSPRPLKFVMGP